MRSSRGTPRVPTSRRPARSCHGPAPDPRRGAASPRGSATRGLADGGRQALPLGIQARGPAPGGVPDRGRSAAARDGACQRGEERRPEAARGRGPHRRAVPVRERARDRGRPRHDRGPQGHRRGRGPPARRRLRGGGGRRRLAVHAARGRGQDARLVHPPGAAPRALRAGHHQQPGRRPDRAAAR